jgi:phenylacetate-CoA ligase
MDLLTVTCEAADHHEAAHGKARETLAIHIKSRYGLSADIVIVLPGTLARSEGKAKRVFDHRKGEP